METISYSCARIYANLLKGLYIATKAPVHCLTVSRHRDGWRQVTRCALPFRLDSVVTFSAGDTSHCIRSTALSRHPAPSGELSLSHSNFHQEVRSPREPMVIPTSAGAAASNANELETTRPLSLSSSSDASSAPTDAKSPTAFPLRMRINCDDDALRARLEDNLKQLIDAAVEGTGSDNNTLLAKKALKHRKILERMAEVDVNHPSFDLSKFLGVDWTTQQEGDENEDA